MDLATLDQYRKAVVALLIAAFALAVFFFTFDPGLQLAAVAFVIAAFNVAAVFMTKNHTADDVGKAVQALIASALGLVAFFVTVDPNLAESLGAFAIAVINVYGVWRATNLARL